MSGVENFIHDLEGEQQEIMTYLHTWLSEDVGLIPKIRYSIPFYYKNTWILYLSPTKKGTVDFSFIRARELSNEQGLLDFRNRKMVATLEIASVDTIPYESLEEVLQEAITLDEMKPYTFVKKRV